MWGFVLLAYFVFTLKTNAVFAGIFLFVTIGAWILSGAYWKVSTGDYDEAMRLQKVSRRMSHPRSCLLLSISNETNIC